MRIMLFQKVTLYKWESENMTNATGCNANNVVFPDLCNRL